MHRRPPPALIDHVHGDKLIALDRVPPGQSVQIARLVGCPEHVRRLEEMGLRPGVVVHVVRHGRPCIVRSGSSRLCFRCSDLLGVLVHNCPVANE
ncbi:MAG: ferrous iron transport protein A [Planctomycetaceae bacterium]|nr:ferrous iron transport protein A [Planctomycetaceae bacterium]